MKFLDFIKVKIYSSSIFWNSLVVIGFIYCFVEDLIFNIWFYISKTFKIGKYKDY